MWFFHICSTFFLAKNRPWPWPPWPSSSAAIQISSSASACVSWWWLGDEKMDQELTRPGKHAKNYGKFMEV
jgi:hypothetical protein